jgi:hypothetical protein
MSATLTQDDLFGVQLEPWRIAETFDPQPDPYADDPCGWVGDRLGETLWSKQQEIMESVRDNRYTAVQSAHDTGKSYDASRLVAWWLDVHPVGEAFAVTTAPTQPQVNAILWREIRAAHRKGGLPGRITLDAHWYMGHDELVAYGRKPMDYADANQAMQAFQGIHARYVLVILDEACGIPKWLYDATDSLATNENSRVLAIGNPDDPASQFERVCRPGSGWHQIAISAFDTPAYTGEDVPEALLEMLVSKTWVEERKKRWGQQSPLYQSKVLGQFPDVSDDTLIQPKWIREAQERDLSGTMIKDIGQFGGDVARMGSDETCVARKRGQHVRIVYGAHKQSTTETSGAFGNLIREVKLQAPMAVDADGLGAGVYDNLAEDDLPVSEFHGGASPIDGERFKNLRAERYWALREAFEAGEVDIDPDDDQLASQLSSMKWKLDRKGRIQIESKEDMRKRGMPSPDRADAVMMAWVRDALDLDTFLQANEEYRRSGITDDLTEKQF